MFKKMTRVFAVVMALAMVFSCVALLASCKDPDQVEGGLVRDPNAEYTYNTFMSTFPTVWNNHTYQTATDSEIIGYTESGFYTFDYNETLDGYKIVPDMATSEPVDVTSDYVGEEWGIAEGDTARAWKITLRQDIKWEDGTPINANDFVESAKRLLNPVANNYRADSLYNGNMVIHNAKNYFYGGKDVTLAANGIYDTYSEDLDADLVFSLAPPSDERNCEVYMRTSFGFPASYDAAKCAAYLIANYLADTAFTAEAAAAMEGKTFAEIKADATLKAAWDALIGWWQTDPNEELHFFVADKTYEEMEFDKVGIKAVSDYELVLIMDKPLEGFYLLYALTGAWLVKTDLYDSCITITDGVYNINYGTSVDTYMAYGPYKLTTFQADKQIVLEKNDQYYGYNDEANENCYWTTKIVYDYIQNGETAMEAFLQGKLDAKGLDVDQMETYSKSEHCYYTTGDSTFFIAINPDKAALESEQAAVGENINKTILTIKEFRQALSFSLDRAAFCLATSPSNAPAFGAYSSLIISDPENGTAYRTTAQAKNVLVNFWGVADEIGEGKLYATVDEAIDSITGYNLDMGKEYFNTAYDKAIAEGLMDEDDVIEICVGIPNPESKFYNNGYDFLVNNYTEAVKGTKLEGKLTFTKDDTIGNGFSDALKANQVNLLFGVGWTGSALDPYGLMEAYTSTDYQYDPAWNTTTEMLTIEIGGKNYSATVWDWTLAIMGEKINITADDKSTVEYSCGTADKKPEERLDILAALEGAVLQTYDMIPIMDDASAALKGMQIKYYTEEYIYGVGRGGVKYMQYYYTDAQWAEFVASQGGTLNYK
ncbi:MAG: DUF4044 domain-containing protein [Clostridia bacterium]|nr:DUF4044 domain-containing protein [Clostridia bacterium]